MISQPYDQICLVDSPPQPLLRWEREAGSAGGADLAGAQEWGTGQAQVFKSQLYIYGGLAW